MVASIWANDDINHDDYGPIISREQLTIGRILKFLTSKGGTMYKYKDIYTSW